MVLYKFLIKINLIHIFLINKVNTAIFKTEQSPCNPRGLRIFILTRQLKNLNNPAKLREETKNYLLVSTLDT